MVGLRINETLLTGAVGNRTYRVGLNAVRLGNRPYRGRKCLWYFLTDCFFQSGEPHGVVVQGLEAIYFRL